MPTIYISMDDIRLISAYRYIIQAIKDDEDPSEYIDAIEALETLASDTELSQQVHSYEKFGDPYDETK